MSSHYRWQFWIDRGGTFTDIVARNPSGRITTKKLLSENPQQYADAALHGIREILNISDDSPLPIGEIEAIKMGTTIGTNALLERQGERTVLAITAGFRDCLRIGYQNRPDIFALDIKLPALLYDEAVEINERCSAQGEVLVSVDLLLAKRDLQAAFDRGIRSVAIVLMHAWQKTDHELAVAEVAKEIGFSQISLSHQVSPLMKIVGRGDTTVVDAYLSPLLFRYIDRVSKGFEQSSSSTLLNSWRETSIFPQSSKDKAGNTPRLMFMQSNGGLIDAKYFRGKDCILSGPAGGIVGAVATASKAGFNKIITFDMGGTSTDVAHFTGEYERQFETEVAGVRMRAPMMDIHTVAAGGGSILQFDGMRFRVGPQSAGANPGPACYRRGGPLSVTDANVMLRKILPDYFPKVFGPSSNESIDQTIVRKKFVELAEEISASGSGEKSPQQIAEGFLEVAVENMATAIKKISVQRGYDVSKYTLCCFGAAAGQHACRVAENLAIGQIFFHPYAGVLSAYGMGLADFRVIRQRSVERVLSDKTIIEVKAVLTKLELDAKAEILAQGIVEVNTRSNHRVYLKYSGTDTALDVGFSSHADMISAFEHRHQSRFGFVYDDKDFIVESVSVEVIGSTGLVDDPVRNYSIQSIPQPASIGEMFTHNKIWETPVFERKRLKPGHQIVGPALIIEPIATTVIEPGWKAEITIRSDLLVRRSDTTLAKAKIGNRVDPVMLEIFNKLFMSIAEQMGYTLQNTAYSVNIKERLDFSCAIFDANGELIANAPHIPVHLGSMGASVQALVEAETGNMEIGDVFLTNSPYQGGTHLPDITVITPVFDDAGNTILFFVACRGHHADIGGVTPGSMPPNSTHIEQEGVIIANLKLVKNGHFQEDLLTRWLLQSRYPARNPKQNIADLRAQIAANEKGLQELSKMVTRYSLRTVQAYMKHVKNNATESMKRTLANLDGGKFSYAMDHGAKINVEIDIDKGTKTARIDFTGTSRQLVNNFNAPAAVCKAAVLYVFRTLIEDDIPLNAGCLTPLDIIIPEGSMLNPKFPAAVVAGNVETSQYIVDTLYGALGRMAGSQGTMNNFTFGNDVYQYYETICGGSGAGSGFNGCNAVQTHMTNSRITDPEVLEWRFPVILEEFKIRPKSGGSGRLSGGNGVERRIRFLETMNAAILSSHRVHPPFGLNGGECGLCGVNSIIRKDGSVIILGGCDEVQMNSGDVFIIKTPGGGGYGKELK